MFFPSGGSGGNAPYDDPVCAGIIFLPAEALAAFGAPVRVEVIGNLNFHHVISVAFIAGNGQYLRQSLYASGISAPGISAASEELSISSISLNQLATTPGAYIVFYHDFFRRSLLFRLLFG